MNTIQGDQGCILIDHSINTFQHYRIIKNDGSETFYETADFKHRMYQEFIDIVKAIDTENFEYMEKMMELSLTVSKTMEIARKQAGIIF